MNDDNEMIDDDDAISEIPGYCFYEEPIESCRMAWEERNPNSHCDRLRSCIPLFHWWLTQLVLTSAMYCCD